MKTLFMLVGLLLSLSSMLSSGSLSSTEITNMISKIKEEREGISMATLENTVSPFHLNKKKEVVEEEKNSIEELPIQEEYNLQAILNHAAFINKKWYKRGATLGIYHVGYIGRSSVTLTSSHGNKILSIKKKKKLFIKFNQGKK